MNGQVALLAYAVALGLLGVFGIHRLYLVVLYLRTRAAAPRPHRVTEGWPTVTVQLPVYNELYVVERLLGAVAQLDYPADRIEIQVLDDSDDETRKAVARGVAKLREDGLVATHLHRSSRKGFKAGALDEGLARATGEFVCVFDADFVPGPDFLRRAMAHFDDPEVGMVQARWGHLNRSSSLLTWIQSVFLDAHFVIEHAARSRAGRFFNFNGTAGVWRRQAILDAGGWQHDTLTEDLDLSYRAQLAGWRFVYLDDLAAPAELPDGVTAFKSQQRRWTRGAAQTARKLLPRIWRSAAPLSTKIEATFHLTSNLAYLLMVVVGALAFPVMVLREQGTGGWVLWVELPVLLLGSGSVCLYFVLAQREVGNSWFRTLLRAPALMALGAGLALSNSVAVVRGLAGSVGSFVRTPKSAATATTSAATRPAHYRAPFDWLLLAEAFAALGFAGAWWSALNQGMWLGLPILSLFVAGYGYVSALGLSQVWRARHGARA